MSNVYVVNKSNHDISDAKRFGKLVYLSKSIQPRYNTNNICRTFLPVLKTSSKNDYILITGLTISNVIACSIFAILHNRLNLLIHQVEGNSYKERILDLSNLKGAEK